MSDCPRCKLELQAEEYEGVPALFCSTCWGHWMSKESFTRMLKNEEYEFSTEERAAVLDGWGNAGAADVDLEPVVHCPICSKATTRKQFADDCPVELDLCDDHGVWLDASEVKQVQVYFDSLND